jgi:hypothetical protein
MESKTIKIGENKFFIGKIVMIANITIAAKVEVTIRM